MPKTNDKGTPAKLVNRGPAGLLSKAVGGGRPGKLTNRGGAGLLVKPTEEEKGRNGEDTPPPEAPEGGWAQNKITPTLRAKKMVVKIKDLNQDPNNCRLHPERNIESIKYSLHQYGQRTAIVVRKEGMTIAKGNGTYQAAVEMGWTEIAADVQSMTEVEFAGYALADNRTAEFARWDFENVARVERLISEAGQPMIGWTSAEIRAMRMQACPRQEDPDVIPPAPKVPLTKTGDLWVMGDHRLICGDSTDKKAVTKLVGKDKAWLMVTDPPYGVDFEVQKYNPRAKDWDGIKGDKVQGKDLTEFTKTLLNVWFPYMMEQASFYLWSAPMQEGYAVLIALRELGLNVQSQIVWAKNVLVLGQADYHWKHEICWYSFWKGKKHRWLGGRDKTSLWEVKKINNADYLHPMQKPTELYEIPIANHTTDGEIVVEPFAGSGTQFIAAQTLGRRCFGMELDPIYCDVTLQRWADFTGLDPIREDGKSFKKLKASKK